MVWIIVEGEKVKQYASSNNNDGTKKISSGKIDLGEIGKPLVGKPVYVCIKPEPGVEITFVDLVKSRTERKYKISYVSAMCLKDLIGQKVDADIIEIE